MQHALNGGEVRIGNYWVDGYDKENKIIFEYDEDYISSMSKLIYLLSNSSNKQKNDFERIMIGNGDSAFFIDNLSN